MGEYRSRAASISAQFFSSIETSQTGNWRTKKKKKEEEGKRHDTRGERYYSDGTLPSYRVLSAGKGKREGERINGGKRVISFMANKHRWVAN